MSCNEDQDEREGGKLQARRAAVKETLHEDQDEGESWGGVVECMVAPMKTRTKVRAGINTPYDIATGHS
jgi:hypothetical protein